MKSPQLPLVLAKDRYYLLQQAKRLSQNPAGDDAQKQQQKFYKRLEASTNSVEERKNSVPVIQLNEDLPVSQKSDALIKAIQQNQVIIVAGETGSGKTTQLPKIALLAGRGLTGQIGHTQPRRLAARSVSTRIAEELGEPLGQTVSYKVRFNEQGSPKSLIKLMTDGILLAELGHDKFLSRYDTIIIDEAHERSLNIDFILGYLKNLLPKRPDLKVIITSATLDTERFSKYFSRYNRKTKQSIPAPVFNVDGRSYPVEVRYRPLTDAPVTSSDDDSFDDFEDNLPRAVVAAAQECFDDAQTNGHPEQADILVFAATEAEIRDLQEVLEKHAFRHTQVLPLYARQTFAEQQRIFSPSNKGRRIIIATNVAETALTVPNIRYVIDLGFARISRYNYRSRVQRLPIEAISQAAANQRKGRCGRIAAGVCIRLYSEEDFASRPEFTEPEILRTNLASVMLQMAHLRIGSVEDFDFIEPPDSRLVKDGAKLLEELGALSKNKGNNKLANKNSHKNKTKPSYAKNKPARNQMQLSNVGQKMARMPIDPRLARMLIAGNDFDCLQDMLVIVSALAVQDPRERPHEKRTQADQKHALFKKDDSDFLFYLSLWQAIYGTDEQGVKLSSNQRRQFAKKHYLSFPRIREWQKTYQQLVQMVEDMGLTGLSVKNNKANKNKGQTKQAKQRLSLNNGLSNKQNKNSLSRAMSNALDKKNKEHNTSHQQSDKYANLHRALLTGLLSFIAHKGDERGQYLATRQQKTKIFPSSTLFKSSPNWVMSFEIVETSQVFMRTLAKIEPEWIISAANGLLKYHYFEPHWSKKTGRVRAYAQISLFGLTVVAKQLCNYEQVNMSEAREIFIRDGLVTGELGYEAKGRKAPFLQNNMDKIADVERIEEKLRRRDLLVDEEALYQFYDNKIPAHIASRKAFEDWRAEVETTNNQYLFFTDEDVLTQAAPTTGDFPEVWKLGNLKLPLSYVFDPANEDDGVSIRVPLLALPQLDSVELLWGIAGWRYELVLQLLKTLPKEIRRQIVPIPDTADKLFDELERNHQQGLLKQLCEALNKKGVVGVEPKHFDPGKVDNYLQPQICVVDDKNRLIEKGRDLATLQARHAIKTSQAIQEQQGLHHEFPPYFKFSKNRHSAGIVMQEFSALVADAKGDAVSIHKFTDLNAAIKAHRIGVLTLIKNQLSAKQKQLTGQIDKAFKLAFAPLGQLDKLKQIVVDATLDATLSKHFVEFDHTNILPEVVDGQTKQYACGLPLTQNEYQETESLVLSQFLLEGQQIIKLLKQVYTRWQRIRQSLLMLDRDVFAESIDDIEDQLDDLHLADFVYRMDYINWQQYPRYLEALEIRMERLVHNLDNDLDAVYELDVHMERLAQRGNDPKIADYRWLVEEFRIQLFAQPMKTKASVSSKRLDKLWLKLTS
ncbi:ATP-dependent RNA helicase HrpA [Psychrobacter sp. HD31]|uniref:ATP-dependent RNA helicase HrpA n=1 Tax=Psychrobacter sp. HD31 TaxID=3112003 RepID=UPI003DA57CF2